MTGSTPALSVIVVSWETRELLLACVGSAARALSADGSRPPLAAEVLVVDNGSRDGSAEAVRRGFPGVRVIALPENRGFAGGCNAGLRAARGRTVLLLNSDALLTRDAVDRCLAALDARPDAGAVGPQLVHPDGRLQNSVHRFPGLVTELLPRSLLELALPRRFPSKRRLPDGPVEVEAVLGAALFARREVVERVGFLPEDYFFFLEETDWCWSLREAGWRVLWVPSARVVHGSGASSKRRHPALTRIEYHRSLYRFVRRRRGRGVLVAVVAIRLLRCAGTALLLALPALVSGRHRQRLGERVALAAWHLRGCPPEPGLRQLSRSTAERETATLAR